MYDRGEVDIDKLMAEDGIETIRLLKLVNAIVVWTAGQFHGEFSAEDIEDIAQEVYERLLKKGYKPLRGRSIKEIRAWICKTAYNIMIDKLRARRRCSYGDDHVDDQTVSPEPFPDKAAVIKEIKRDILMRIHNLPKMKRLVAILHLLEGKSQGKTAEITGLALKTVYKYVHEIRKEIIEKVKFQ